MGITGVIQMFCHKCGTQNPRSSEVFAYNFDTLFFGDTCKHIQIAYYQV